MGQFEIHPNLDFDLQKDKSPCDDNLLQPYRIVSLWEMLPFYAIRFLKISNLLNELKNSRVMFKQEAWEKEEWENWCNQFRVLLVIHQTTLAEMGLIHSEKRVQKLLNLIEGEKIHEKQDDIRRLINDLNEMFIEELESRKLFITRLGQSHFFDMDGTFLGPYILSKLPDLQDDADEAGNCFALGRYTACVFHLMRMMEIPVQRLGRKFKIPNLDKKTWGQILHELYPRIEKMYGVPTRNYTVIQEGTRNKYLHCYSLLDAVNRSTRVPTMHHKITDVQRAYTEQQAKDAMDRVKTFIEDFTKLPGFRYKAVP